MPLFRHLNPVWCLHFVARFFSVHSLLISFICRRFWDVTQLFPKKVYHGDGLCDIPKEGSPRLKRPRPVTDDVKQKQKNQETTNNIQTPTRA